MMALMKAGATAAGEIIQMLKVDQAGAEVQELVEPLRGAAHLEVPVTGQADQVEGNKPFPKRIA